MACALLVLEKPKSNSEASLGLFFFKQKRIFIQHILHIYTTRCETFVRRALAMCIIGEYDTNNLTIHSTPSQRAATRRIRLRRCLRLPFDCILTVLLRHRCEYLLRGDPREVLRPRKEINTAFRVFLCKKKRPGTIVPSPWPHPSKMPHKPPMHDYNTLIIFMQAVSSLFPKLVNHAQFRQLRAIFLSVDHQSLTTESIVTVDPIPRLRNRNSFQISADKIPQVTQNIRHAQGRIH